MVDYIPIAETEDDPEAPITSSWGKRVRNNPIAIAEGASGAPRIEEPAYDDESVSTRALATNERITAANIGGAIADISAGGVGDRGIFRFVQTSGQAARAPGFTTAGSNLSWTSFRTTGAVGSSPQNVNQAHWSGNPSGTWSLRGFIPQDMSDSHTYYAEWVRVA